LLSAQVLSTQVPVSVCGVCVRHQAMPVDYSKFTGIGDSSEDEAPDFAQLLSRVQGCDAASDGDDSPAESPRQALARTAAASANPPPAEVVDVDNSRPPLSLEHFLQLAKGAVQLSKHEDAAELVALARAALQSSVSAGEAKVACEVVGALLAGLSKQPSAVTFAKEQAPEFVADLVVAEASGCVPQDDCEKLLGLLVNKCKPRELYTFLIEALCDDDLCSAARVRSIHLLRATFLRMDADKRHLFLGSALPVMLKKSLMLGTSEEQLTEQLAAMREFGLQLLPEERSTETGPAKVSQALISGFFFKVMLKGLPLCAAVRTLGFASSREQEALPECLPRHERTSKSQRIELHYSRTGGSALEELCAVGREAAASSTKPLLALLEEMDVGDATSDGGGDVEVSPLCLAAYVCLLELEGGWRKLRPLVLPIGLSPARRVNILMRSCSVLVANQQHTPEVVGLNHSEPASGSGSSGSCWSHRGFALLATSAAPLLRVASGQTPHAYSSLSGSLCRWYPQRTFQGLLEGLASSPSIEREVRGALFRVVAEAMRAFSWQCRFELYLAMISKCRLDSVVSAVVTMFKDDWWSRVRSQADGSEGLLAEERGRLSKVLKATLAGDIQIVDGMDTLTAALNVARLVALAGPPVGPFLREGCRQETDHQQPTMIQEIQGLRKSSHGIDLDSLLAGISKQIDIELQLIDQNPGDLAGPAAVLGRAMEEALDKAQGGVDLKEMKRDRISMVAHLVARVRELLAGAAGSEAAAV